MRQVPPFCSSTCSTPPSTYWRASISNDRETEPNWAADLREDVRGECARYGPVRDVVVDMQSPDGEVYVCFSDVVPAQYAHAGLHGRFFGGKRIEASLYVTWYIPN